MSQLNMCLQHPNTDICLFPDYKVKLGRFSQDRWIVKYGWYSWGGNREVCGWYLIDENDMAIVKPLQSADLIDIYIIES